MSRIGILADIHSNIQALDTALSLLKKEGITQIYVCGDIVGYGQAPNRCCYRIHNSGAKVVAGNHDWAVAGKMDYKNKFGKSAIEGVEKNIAKMDDANFEWLRNLPLHHRKDDMEFTHASLYKTDAWPYLAIGATSEDSIYQNVEESFKQMVGSICFVGHSHRPAIFIKDLSGNVDVIPPDENWIELLNMKAVVDVGSVGKPRDNALFGSFVIFDTDTRCLRYVRVPI